MKMIFKKKFGAFNWYSNGRIYCDLDRLFKRKPKDKTARIKKHMASQQTCISNLEKELDKTDVDYKKQTIFMKVLMAVLGVMSLILTVVIPPFILLTIFCFYKMFTYKHNNKRYINQLNTMININNDIIDQEKKILGIDKEEE